ncbi:MAG: hypothetical protein HUJ75_02230 [Parasporobacterium sp.]|nr:hypothetical protein [Parasporobacterium sp.]
MLYVYIALAVLLGIIFITSLKYKKELFADLDKKEHPLRFVYPTAAKILDKVDKVLKVRSLRVKKLLKNLLVKENVEKELYIHRVKKCAVSLALFSVFIFMGLAASISYRTISHIRELERADAGRGSTEYELEAHYEGKDELINITIPERKLSPEEISKAMDEAAERLKSEVLGENESFENVNKPLKLVSTFEDYELSWEIDDEDVLKYSGEAAFEIKEGEQWLVNLYVTFSKEEVSKTYNIPAVITAPVQTAKELLTDLIDECIEEGNSIYDSSVKLPDNINGEKISFTKKTEQNEYIFLVLGLVALIAILIVFDRTLDDKLKKRREQMMMDFAEIVSKLSLLYEAGLSILSAWERIVEDYEKRGVRRYAYEEMKLTLEKIKSGSREGESYAEFGKRCALHPYIKLGNILEQNLSKGTKGMKLLLKQEVEDAFEERKRLARKKGEEAGTKLLVPMIMMLIIVIVIVAVPALMSMSF